ncbi:MAG: hypothetical protein H0U16_06350 [Actinobacteria bacterium]|nr:hypothetical protein [Actinomycetota bacterium]
MIPDWRPSVEHQSSSRLVNRVGVLPELLVLHAVLFFTVVALTPSTELFPNHGDVLLYFQYAERITQGQLPYRDIPLEYPPLSLLAFVLPYVAWPGAGPRSRRTSGSF